MIDFKSILTPFGEGDYTIHYRPGSAFPWVFIKWSYTTHARSYPRLIRKLNANNHEAAQAAREALEENLDSFLEILVKQRDLLRDILIENIKAAKSPIAESSLKLIAETERIMRACGFTERELHE